MSSGTTRRGFLRGMAGVGAGIGAVASGVRVAGASDDGQSVDGTLVLVTLVGGVDGLSVLVPHAAPAYAERRPTIAIAPPGDPHGAIDLGGGWGLHPALAPLFNTAGLDEQLAVVAGVGPPPGAVVEGSHLSGRAFLDSGGGAAGEGWAARMLDIEGLGPHAAWSFGSGIHGTLTGSAGSVAARRPGVGPGPHTRPGDAVASLRSAYAGSSTVARAGSAALAASAHWAGTSWTSADGRAAFGYPSGGLGGQLATTADMILADRGLRFVAIDHDGYDTHVDQGDGSGGQLAHRLDRLARALAAFWRHLDAASARVSVVVVTELGRSIDENRAGGTEHGDGTVAMVLGTGVVGGVHGDLPDVDGTDSWPASIDVRVVLAEGAASMGFRPWDVGVFPGLAVPDGPLGLLLST